MYDLIRSNNRNSDLYTLPNLVSRFFEEAAARPGSSLMPHADVLEASNEIRLVVEVPGLDRETLSVTLEGSTLNIAGEKKPLWDVAEGACYVGERRFGKFSRSFTIPVRVDAANISAKYTDGLLEVVLPKAPEAQPRRIEVK